MIQEKFNDFYLKLQQRDANALFLSVLVAIFVLIHWDFVLGMDGWGEVGVIKQIKCNNLLPSEAAGDAFFETIA